MRRKVEDREAAIRRDRILLQNKITEKWGEEYIKAARLRLCPKCARLPSCFLLPICSDGTDCNYFIQREEV